MTLTIDEEGRRSIDPTAHPAQKIFPHAISKGTRRQIALELRRIEAEIPGVLEQVGIIKALLVFIEGVVHLPKLPLGARCLRCRGSLLGMGMHSLQGKVAKDEAQLVAKLPLKLLDNGVGCSTIGALEVPILKQREWRRCGPLRVIARANGKGEMGQYAPALLEPPYVAAAAFVNDSRAVRMSSAPGFTPTGET